MTHTAPATSQTISTQPKFKGFNQNHLAQMPHLERLPSDLRFDITVVAQILPFRVNQYVLDELIDWDNATNDPMFILLFPQRDMLAPKDFDRMAELLRSGANSASIRQLADEIRKGLNPHPSGQMELNVPTLDGNRVSGMQHKYRETVLFFPSHGQVCHSYCTFCFRWAQFVGDKSLRFASNEVRQLHQYLAEHKEVSDLLLTGGDPMVMKTHHIQEYIEPLASPELEHVQTLRIGTKALTFWPQRFVTDADADDLLRSLESLVNSGKHVSIMAHYNHWRELEPEMTQKAIARIRNTGAEIRCQGPLLKNINDDPAVWTRLWTDQVRLGMIPYYMFVERDTGARRFFEVPLGRAYEIYQSAIQDVSGLARTVRGPSMSAGPGKVEVRGVTEIAGEKVYVLRFLQGRNKEWAARPFFAKYNANATWLNDLEPAFDEGEFFYEKEYNQMIADKSAKKIQPSFVESP